MATTEAFVKTAPILQPYSLQTAPPNACPPEREGRICVPSAAPGTLGLELFLIEARVESSQSQKLLVPALFNNAPVIYDQNPIGPQDR